MFIISTEPTLIQRCKTPADIAFLLDSSAGIGAANFQKLKVFVKKIVSNFDLSPKAVRGAVVLYSNAASTRIWFDDFLDIEAFGYAINKISYEPGGNMIDLALENVYSNLFGPNGNSRTNVSRVAIVFTGGVQTLTPFSVTLDIASFPLKARGVRIVVVGIGSLVDASELYLMVNNKDDLFLLKSFNTLHRSIDKLTTLLCPKGKHFLFIKSQMSLIIQTRALHTTYS